MGTKKQARAQSYLSLFLTQRGDTNTGTPPPLFFSAPPVPVPPQKPLQSRLGSGIQVQRQGDPRCLRNGTEERKGEGSQRQVPESGGQREVGRDRGLAPGVQAEKGPRRRGGVRGVGGQEERSPVRSDSVEAGARRGGEVVVSCVSCVAGVVTPIMNGGSTPIESKAPLIPVQVRTEAEVVVSSLLRETRDLYQGAKKNHVCCCSLLRTSNYIKGNECGQQIFVSFFRFHGHTTAVCCCTLPFQGRPGLFHGITFHFRGEFGTTDSPPLSELEPMLLANGGRVVSTIASLFTRPAGAGAGAGGEGAGRRGSGGGSGSGGWKPRRVVIFQPSSASPAEDARALERELATLTAAEPSSQNASSESARGGGGRGGPGPDGSAVEVVKPIWLVDSVGCFGVLRPSGQHRLPTFRGES